MTEQDYQRLSDQLRAITEQVPNTISNLANASALLWLELSDINWAGFYLVDSNNDLTLGPFQGKPACTHIPFNRGVCGTAFAQQQTLRVEDVHQFEGHISCDSASNSEIVIPLISGEIIWGVLDIDSPRLNRFSEQDQLGLELFVKTLCETTPALLP